ncbi:glycoside hydrolase family protein [Arenibacter sp. F20364]|uniref:glycoside hydrolase family protein n=1 Tax=Arenibacter sp. F20364 TaxID=2926415 RepID=UPI001FF570A2|nr:glycoside hydrolase family protein [Arenibacter sp. F20364]MCK0190262.1 glycoside hydrolase family protein [Arenibacter sp. F20364]
MKVKMCHGAKENYKLKLNGTLSYLILAILLLGTHNSFFCRAQNIRVTAGRIDSKMVDVMESPNEIIGASIFQIPNYFVWGASVVKGDDGKYHMLFSLWESGKEGGSFARDWVLQSKIGYAVSDYPDRDFEFQKIVLKGTRYHGDYSSWDAQMVHNPHIKKFNGKYYLYYIGSKDPGEQPKGSKGENLDQRSRVQQSLCIGVLEFESFENLLSGNFDRPKRPLLIPRTRVKSDHILNGSPIGTKAKPDNIIVVNPSVDYNPINQKYMLYFKGNVYEPEWKGVHGVAIGNNPNGPFRPLDSFVFDVRMPNGTLASTEDPFVWYSHKIQKFLAIVKDFSGRLTGHKKTLALLSSSDGIVWDLTKNPLFMERKLLLTDGSIIEVDRLERPQLLLNDEGIPQYLYAASALGNVNAKNDGSSFNVQIPLEVIVE